MSQQRLNNLLVLHVHKDITDAVNLQKIARVYRALRTYSNAQV